MQHSQLWFKLIFAAIIADVGHLIAQKRNSFRKRLVTHTGRIQIQIACTTIGLTRPALWSKLSPLSVCQGFRNLSSWVSEYQRLTGTKSCFRETGNNSDKESLLMRGTDLPNENHSYMSWCCYSNIMETTYRIGVVKLMCLSSIHHLRPYSLQFVSLRVVSKQQPAGMRH